MTPRRGQDARCNAMQALLCVLAWATPWSVIAAPPPANPTAQTKGAELDQLRNTIREVQSQLQEARGDKEQAEAELAITEGRIQGVRRTLREVDHKLQELNTRLRLLRSTQRAQETRLRTQRELLARQIRANYALGRQGAARLLLSDADPAVIGRTLVYYDYLSRARAQSIADINATLHNLTALEEGINKESQELARLTERRREQQHALGDQIERRRGLIAQLDAQIQTGEQRLARLHEDERALGQLVERLRQQLSKTPKDAVKGGGPFAKLKGKLPWPAEGRLMARFGSPRGVGALSWPGVLIGASAGAPVRAVSAGHVVFADFLRGYGLLVIVDHGDGYMSLYGRNRALQKEEGDAVTAGELIATAGGGEGTDDAGMYFEIRHLGKPVNPQQWCRAMPR